MPGYSAKFFADSVHGGERASLRAAQEWRDKHWDGTDRNTKLSPSDRAVIRHSKKHYAEIAEEYGISPNYVHQIRRGT